MNITHVIKPTTFLYREIILFPSAHLAYKSSAYIGEVFVMCDVCLWTERTHLL